MLLVFDPAPGMFLPVLWFFCGRGASSWDVPLEIPFLLINLQFIE